MVNQFVVQRCNEPTDENFGGWDILIRLPDGTLSCVGETRFLDRVGHLLSLAEAE